jgi:hypothetical protein
VVGFYGSNQFYQEFNQTSNYYLDTTDFLCILFWHPYEKNHFFRNLKNKIWHHFGTPALKMHFFLKNQNPAISVTTGLSFHGRYWIRTSDPYHVKEYGHDYFFDGHWIYAILKFHVTNMSLKCSKQHGFRFIIVPDLSG